MLPGLAPLPFLLAQLLASALLLVSLHPAQQATFKSPALEHSAPAQATPTTEHQHRTLAPDCRRAATLSPTAIPVEQSRFNPILRWCRDFLCPRARMSRLIMPRP